jgi:hypothetical protein
VKESKCTVEKMVMCMKIMIEYGIEYNEHRFIQDKVYYGKKLIYLIDNNDDERYNREKHKKSRKF